MKKEIPIKKIIPDPDQPRKYFGKQEMAELKESIRKQGVLNPIIVEDSYQGDNFLLLDGERRYRASVALGLTEMPATVIKGPLTKIERTTKRFHLQEQHSNWSIFDKAGAIFEYQRDTGFSLVVLAEKLNLNVPKVHGWLSINEFTEYGKSLVIQNYISFSYLIFLIRIVKRYMEISDLKQEEIEERMIDKIKRENFKVVGDIQVYSKIMAINGNEKKKIEFLNNPRYTLEDYLSDTKINLDFKRKSLSDTLLKLDEELTEVISKKIFLSDTHKKLLNAIKIKISKIL